MIHADLWSLSKVGDPWEFFDLLLLENGLNGLFQWKTNPNSISLYWGGHHYGEGRPSFVLDKGARGATPLLYSELDYIIMSSGISR